MKLFISWSGDSSKAVAEALRDWLPCVIQAVKPWMSKADLKSGSRWALELARELSETRVGLICLTPANLSEPWILFEAGALSKTLDNKTLVCTYLLGVNPADLSEPLGQFQATVADEAGTRKLLSDINQMLDDKLSEENLDRLFGALWLQLDNSLKAAASLRPAEERPRSERDILEEILALARQQARSEAERQERKRFEQMAKGLGGFQPYIESNVLPSIYAGGAAPSGKSTQPTTYAGGAAPSNKSTQPTTYAGGAAPSNKSTQPTTPSELGQDEHHEGEGKEK